MKHRHELHDHTKSLHRVELIGSRQSEVIAEIAGSANPVILVSERGEKAVALSLDLYEALQETLEVLSDPDTMRAVEKGIAGLEAGRTHSHQEVFGAGSGSSNTRT